MKQIKTIFSFFLIVASINILSSCGLFSETNSDSNSDSINETEVMAVDIKDKDSLKKFVLSAKKHLEKDFDTAVQDFKTKDNWKKDSIYVYGITTDGKSVFNPPMPEIEGTDLLQNPKAKAGVEMAFEAVKKGGGFIEYIWDDPSIEGADDTKKISYVTTFKKDGVDYIVGSGFYVKE